MPSPTPPTAVASATPFATPPPEGRQRWGYDPWQPTGEFDPPLPYQPLPPGYRIEAVATGLDRPTQMAATPDGRLLIAEQLGTVRVVEGGELQDEPFASVNAYVLSPEDPGELGLVGIAVDPAFSDNGYVYLYYTADHPRRTVITRLREEDGRAVRGEEILSWEGASPCCHVGGGMRFAPDGTLFIGMGEHQNPNAAQNIANLPGSILRINPDGSAPPDNPFVGVEGADARIYAYGLRNPYDVAIDPETGRAFAGENGLWGQDAIVEIKAGANYGWPGFELRTPESEVEEPLTFYHEIIGIAGLEFYADDELSAFTGRLFYCQFHIGGAVHMLEFAEDGSVEHEKIVASGCETDITTGPDGFLYFLNYQHGILYRIAREEGAGS